ncbi:MULTISPECIES: conjugal transfer protein TraX [Bacillaceae]|uniref:Conjugal transfer protein TraX n=1 Tax=Niallia hominis TaxID=3133173 RepID=A0ABV1F0K7_9BACI|nr:MULTISPECIES: conjugal transfer protein TraX [Bacillaceae]MCM3362219.1 conjugal transfer protein TraX [Niallia sp. MER TA 168]
MIIDHYGEFFPNTPEYLRWIGRISIPIFIVSL